MKSRLRILLAGLFSVGVAAGVCSWLSNLPPASQPRVELPHRTSAGKQAGRASRARSARVVRGKEIGNYFLAYQPFEDGGFSVVYPHMAPIRDSGSLDELREAIRGR